MGLKAMAEAALQQCAPRTIDRTLSDAVPAHSSVEKEVDRTLSEREKLALALAEKAIEQASISAKQKSERRADLTPGIAPFWAVFWEPNQTHSSKEKP